MKGQSPATPTPQPSSRPNLVFLWLLCLCSFPWTSLIRTLILTSSSPCLLQNNNQLIKITTSTIAWWLTQAVQCSICKDGRQNPIHQADLSRSTQKLWSWIHAAIPGLICCGSHVSSFNVLNALSNVAATLLEDSSRSYQSRYWLLSKGWHLSKAGTNPLAEDHLSHTHACIWLEWRISSPDWINFKSKPLLVLYHCNPDL